MCAHVVLCGIRVLGSCKIDTRIWRWEYMPGFQRRIFGMRLFAESENSFSFIMILIPGFVFVVILSLLLVGMIWSSIYRACVPDFRHRAYEMLARLMPVELVSGCMPGFCETLVWRWLLCWV
jgi:hypothetical protein